MGEDEQDLYDQGYMAGLGDMALLDEGDAVGEINGYLLAENGSKARSMGASIAQSMGIN